MRLTQQALDTLRAFGDQAYVSRGALASRLGIPYSSACSRIRRLTEAGLIEGDELLRVTDAGLDALLKKASAA